MKSGFWKKIRRGFTLVEIIIVLVIIAIIAAIAVPNISNYIDNSKKRSCENMMSSFVNDLEYKVVSKRFYDVNDLNTELAGIVRSYGEIESWTENGVKTECSDGQIPPPGTEMQVADICPNGGRYTVKWTITASEDENRLVSAKVNFGVVRSDVRVCECDCLKGNSQVSVETHEFTAALISTHYDPVQHSEDEYAFEFLDTLVTEIESSGVQDTEGVKNLVSEKSNEHYTVAGLVMNGSNVEWLSIYPDPRERETVKFYTYSKNSYSLITEPTKNIWTLPAGKFTDLSEWPPAEGSAGSLVYKEGWNETNVIAVPGNDVKAVRAEDMYENAVDSAETDKLVWIQRDGQWYVQKNNLIPGIDINFSSENDALSPQNHPLVSKAGKELTGISVNTVSGSVDLKHALEVNAVYADGNTVKFSHLTAKTDSDGNPDTSYGAGNGYIFISPEDVNTKTWSGIFSGNSSDMTELEKLLKAEDKLIDDFLTGKKETITIAYQEYFKSLNPENGLYNVPEPVTKFVNIVADSSYIPDSSREYEVVTDEDKVDVVIPVLLPVKVEGSQSDEPLLIPVTVTKPLFGASAPDSSDIPDEINVGGMPVVKVEADENSTSYKVNYSQSSGSDDKFSTNDLTVTRDVTYNIYSTDGTDKDKIGSSAATETVKHTDGTVSGFFVGTENGYSGITENEKSAIEKINSGSASATDKIHLYYYDKAQGTKTVIADITTGAGSASWEYPSELQIFTEENFKNDFKVKITYPVNIKATEKTTVNAAGSVACQLSHADSSNADGFWLSASKDGAWADDSILISQINDLSKTAYVTVKKSDDSSFRNKSVCRIDNTYESLTANYTNDGTNFTAASYSRLEVYGTYKIAFTSENSAEGNTSEIFHRVILNHDEPNTNIHRYFTCVNGNLNKFEDTNFIITWEKGIKSSDRDFLTTYAANTRTQIQNSTRFTAYVYFKDGILKSVPFSHDSTSSINPPDFVYFKTESALASQSEDTPEEAHLVAYLGSDVNVEIPSSFTGYWTATQPASGGYAPRDGYYYVPDGNTYNITRIGKYSSENLPVNAAQATVRFNPGYSFQSLTISEGIREIGPYAFYNAPVSTKGSVKIADSVETIGAHAFSNAGNGNLSWIELGNTDSSSMTTGSSLRTIGASAFRDCSGLTDTKCFIIPSSVVSVGKNAFDNFRMPGGTFVINGVSELEDADSKSSGGAAQESSETTVSALTVDGVKKTGKVSGLPFGDGSDENEKFTVNKLVVGGNTEVIDSEAFTAVNFNGDDSSVEITGYVKIVGDSAFKGTNFRKALSFGSNVEIIDNSAFEDCSEFTGSLNLNKITTIKTNAFAGMTKVTGNLTVPGTVTRLDPGAFDGFASDNKDSETYPALTVNGCTGGSLGAGIFTNGHFKNVSVGGNVKEISARAFKNSPLGGKVPYNELKGTLTIGSSVEKIGLAAFEDCTGFTGNLVIPQNSALTGIGDAAFNGCLGFSGSLTIPSNITEIGSRAFMNCVGFDGELILSSNLNKIGMEAFKNCTKFKKGLTVPSGITGGIGSCAFQKFASAVNDSDRGTLKLYSGSTAGGREIGAFIFTEAKFDGVIVGGTVEKIGASAFHHSNKDDLYLTSDSYITDETKIKVETKESSDRLTADYSGITGSLVIESSVTDIDDMAFFACSSLTGTPMFNAYKNAEGEYISNKTEGVTHFGESAFEGCTGFSGELLVPETVNSIERYAFKSYGNGSCSLKVYGGSNGTVLGSLSEGEDYHPIFPSSAFTNVTIGGNVTEISPLFMDNDLINSIENKNKRVLSDTEKSNYRYSGIRGTLTIESSVTRIGEAAFKKTQFTQIKGGVSADTPALSSVTYVGREAFDNCTQLSGMVSLSNAKTIENAAFRYCSSLRGDNQPGDLQLSNIETVGVSSFEGCTGFTGKLFLNGQNGTGLTSIGTDAFRACTGLTGGVTIPSTVTRIGTGAFAEFSSAGTQGSLEINGVSGKVNAEDEYGYISPGIFTGSYFKNVTIGGNVQTIKADAFRGCTGFTGSLTIGGVVETIEKQAFDTCEYLTGISLENNHLSSIGEGAFARCRRVEDGLYIPSSVNHIDRCAFKYFAENTPDAKLGTLKIYGTSDANGNLGNTVPDSDGGPLFSSARFNGVIIGGNVRTIAHNQFDNKRYYKFGTDLKYGNGNQVAYEEQFGGQDENYDFRGITGDLTIEEGVTAIEGNAFACMNFDNVTIPRSVTSIGETAFMFAGSGDGKLTVLGTSDGGQTLGKGIDHPIFLGAKFNGVVIGGNVRKIENSLMHNQAGLTDKELKQSNTETDESGKNISVAYRFNYTYSDICGPLTIGNSVVEIGTNAFESVQFDGRLILGQKLDDSSPSDVKLEKIGEYAFKNCNHFNGDLIIPHSMKSIDRDAFYRFASDTPEGHSLVFWAGTTDNGNTLGNLIHTNNGDVAVDIFAGAKFKGVGIGGNVHKIEKMAFKNEKTDSRRTYDNITGSLVLGPGVNEIRSEAFLKCKFDGKLGISDPDMVLHGDVNQSDYPDVAIGESAFKDLHDLYTNYTVKDRNGNIVRDSSGNPVQPEFIIPATVKSIGANAFTSLGLNIANKSDYPALKLYGCSLVNGDERVFGVSGRWDRKADIIPYANFRNVTIGGNITTIAENAFDNSSDKYSRFTGNLTIEKTVDKIWKEAFNECTGFDGTLTIESVYDKTDASGNDGLENIGIKAFYGCTNFTGGLHIPYTVKSIESKAFSYFASNVPDDKDGLLNIEGYSAEKDVNFSVFNFNKTKARTIEADIFNHSKFENVSVGWNTEVIEDGFMKSYTKTETDEATGTETTEVFDYSGVTGSLHIGDNVVYIGDEAFSAEFGTPGFNGSLSFGDGNNYKKVIGTKAFAKQQFTGDLKFPYTIGTIGESAFWCCDRFTGELVFNTYTLEKVQNIIPGAQGLPAGYGTDTIGPAAFSGCTGFYSGTTGKTLTIPSTVTSLGENAFYKFGDDISVDSKEYPGLEVLGGTKNSSGKTVLEKQIFPYTKFYNVTIGGSVNKIADDFMNNTIENTYYGKTPAGNAQKVMYNNINGKVTVKGTVTEIGNNAFKSLPLRGGLELENGVTTIGASAFEGCIYASGDITGERRLTIPFSVTSIGNYAFKNFGSMIYEQHLNKLFIYGTTHANGVLDSSQTDIFAGARFTDVTIGGNVRSVSEYCFSDHSKYGYFGGTLTIEKNSVTSLAQSDTNGQHGSFFGCNFNNVYLPESLYNAYSGMRWQVFGRNWNNNGFYNKLS